MGWREEIEALMAKNPKKYPYLDSGKTFAPKWPIVARREVKRILQPLQYPITYRVRRRRYFVVMPPERFRRTPLVVIDDTNPSRRQHFDLSGGKKVLAAGEITTNGNHEITLLSRKSGHYMPEAPSLELAEQIMRVYRLPFAKDFQKYSY
jgi:hypothetical protein